MGCDVSCIATSGKAARAIDAEIVAPWVEVKLSAGGGEDAITVGNESYKPKNTAVIVGFQWGMSDGCGVKVEIVDEEGGAFSAFFEKIWGKMEDLKDKYTMQCRWGWIKNDCNNKPIKTQTKETHTFLLTNIEVIYGDVLKFILEGMDTWNASLDAGNVDQTFGKDDDKIAFKDAVKKLCEISKVKVDFCKFNSTGGVEKDFELKDEYKAVYRANTRNALASIRSWIHDTAIRSKNDKGLTIVFNDTIPNTPTLEIWEDPIPTGVVKLQNRSLGTYIVNGGECSPVIQFSPKFRFPPGAVALTGGIVDTKTKVKGTKAEDHAEKDKVKYEPKMPDGKTYSGSTRNSAIGANAVELSGENATEETEKSTAANNRANAMNIYSTIEADMVIQGNPEMDDPYTVRWASVAVVVLAPWHLDGDNCPTWKPAGGALASSNCIKEMSNSNWLCKGISHEIRQGSYTVTMKLWLPTPNCTISAGKPLGAMPGGVSV